MTDSLADILGNRSYDEPPEAITIKKYVRQKYKSEAAVTVRDQQIIIVVQGAALAGTLRLHLHELKKLCQTEKRLVLRIR